MMPLMRPCFDSEEVKQITEALDSGWVSQGPKTKEFEEKAAKYLGVKHAIALSNCTAALHLGLLACGIKKSDEVLVADYTYPATGHAVLFCQATPRFVDVDVKTYNINLDDAKKKLSSSSKAIIPVHTFGQPADMNALMTFAREHNLIVIEDAACAFGALFEGKQAGTIGEVGCFSFHARKGITTGEGGMAVTNDDALALKIRKLSVFGMQTAWERENTKSLVIPIFTELGFNYKMSDITAAVGIAQLKKLDLILKKKKDLALIYEKMLSGVEGISAPFVAPNADHAYQSYVCLLDADVDRNELIIQLKEKGVQSQIGTYTCHDQPAYGSNDECPRSAEVFKRAIALPFFYQMTENDVTNVISALKECIVDARTKPDTV